MIKAILACDDMYGIGKNGKLPWPSNKEDLMYFRKCTLGHIVVMGYNTWKSIGKVLEGRLNIVCTNDPSKVKGVVKYITSIDEIKAISDGDKDVWIIGGSKLISQCWDIIDEFYLTRIRGIYECDTFIDFPDKKYKLISESKRDNEYYIYKKLDI